MIFLNRRYVMKRIIVVLLVFVMMCSTGGYAYASESYKADESLLVADNFDKGEFKHNH